jgi:adenine specific DNA methylase Mod
MKNRLEVARDLLSEDGVIFVQCDGIAKVRAIFVIEFCITISEFSNLKATCFIFKWKFFFFINKMVNFIIACLSKNSYKAGKVKLIYIDPPYNTGNDSFNYNDNFNHATWLTFMNFFI